MIVLKCCDGRSVRSETLILACASAKALKSKVVIRNPRAARQLGCIFARRAHRTSRANQRRATCHNTHRDRTPDTAVPCVPERYFTHAAATPTLPSFQHSHLHTSCALVWGPQLPCRVAPLPHTSNTLSLHVDRLPPQPRARTGSLPDSSFTSNMSPLPSMSSEI